MFSRADRLRIPILVLLLQTGCLRTEINQGLNAPAGGKPYRKILICSLSKDPGVGAQVEAVLRNDLARHLNVETGRSLLYPQRYRSLEAVIAEIKKDHFDGVLFTQRVEIPVSSSTVKNIILGPAKELPNTDEPTESFATIQDFTAAYLRLLRSDGPPHTDQQLRASVTTAGIVGQEMEVHARADLVGLHENQIVWSTGGLMEGGLHRPILDFIDSFAKIIETGLAQAKFIPG